MRYPFIIGRGLIVLLTLGLVAGMVLVPTAAAQGDGDARLSVLVEALNVRAGPGVAYAVVGVLVQGDQVAVTGHHAASGWWQVRLDDGRQGWVSGGAAYVQVSGDTGGVPEVAAPSTTAAVSAPGRGGTLVFQTASGGPIYAVNVGTPAGVGGSSLRYLTTGIDPALSPDGQRMAFTRWEGPQHGAFGSLWVMNVDGTGERAIHGDVRQPKSPVWSPDGARIAISMQEGGLLTPQDTCSHSLPAAPIEEDFEDIRIDVEIEPGGDIDVKFCYTLLPHPFWGLRTVDVGTGAFQDLPRDLFSYAPTWDPVNDWHLVYDGEGGLVNLDLNQGTTWALTDDVNDYTPAFSPDGSRLAVSYKQHDHWDIHVLNPDGSGRVRLTQTPLSAIVEQEIRGEEPRSWNNVAPAWSPDGSQIAFLSDRTGRWEIWVMAGDGSNQRPMFPNGTLDGLELRYDFVGERALSWR